MITHEDVQRITAEALEEWNTTGHTRMTPEILLIASYWMGQGLRHGYRLGRQEGHASRVEMIFDALCISPRARMLGDGSPPVLQLVKPILTDTFPEEEVLIDG